MHTLVFGASFAGADINASNFLLEEESLYTHVPYIILPYGKSIQVIEPQNLKNKLVAVASELMEYYQV